MSRAAYTRPPGGSITMPSRGRDVFDFRAATSAPRCRMHVIHEISASLHGTSRRFQSLALVKDIVRPDWIFKRHIDEAAPSSVRTDLGVLPLRLLPASCRVVAPVGYARDTLRLVAILEISWLVQTAYPSIVEFCTH
jgi:hypothetical protein